MKAWHVICTVKGADCKSMQHLVADTSHTALSHRLLRDFHQRQTEVQSKISNMIDILIKDRAANQIQYWT